MLVRDIQAIIGREARIQHLQKQAACLMHWLHCVGGGSNAIGCFMILNDHEVAKAVEATKARALIHPITPLRAGWALPVYCTATELI